MELERVEVAGLEGAKEGPPQLHVIMEQTYPTSEYVTAFFLGRGHKVSFAKPNGEGISEMPFPEGANGPRSTRLSWHAYPGSTPSSWGELMFRGLRFESSRYR